MTRGSPFGGWSQNAARDPHGVLLNRPAMSAFKGKADMARRMDAIISAAFDPNRT
jgi:hypothetical protein